jgi:hypothetical protein
MSTRKKTLEKWKNNTPKEENRETVIAMIENYFSGNYTQNATSHIMIKDKRLHEHGITDIAGVLTIPISGGQHVKGKYLKKLVQAIETITNEEI